MGHSRVDVTVHGSVVTNVQNDTDRRSVFPATSVDPTDARRRVLGSALVVQRKELSGIPQPLFPGLRVAHGGDAVPPLTPFGQLDRVSFGPLGSRGGEDALQQPPDIRQRQAVLGFFPQAAAPAGPGTTSPAGPGSYGGGSRARRGPHSRPAPTPACRARNSPRWASGDAPPAPAPAAGNPASHCSGST